MNPVLERLQDEIYRSLDGLTASQTQLRPVDSSGKWTIQQIAQHLSLSYISTYEVVAGRVAKDHPTLAVPTLPQRCAQLFVTRLGYFPTGREAPSVVMPPTASAAPETQFSGVSLAQETSECLARMDQAIDSAQQRFGRRRFASHGVLGPLSASQWRSFHLVHGRHHLEQIRTIRRDHGL